MEVNIQISASTRLLKDTNCNVYVRAMNTIISLVCLNWSHQGPSPMNPLPMAQESNLSPGPSILPWPELCYKCTFVCSCLLLLLNGLDFLTPPRMWSITLPYLIIWGLTADGTCYHCQSDNWHCLGTLFRPCGISPCHRGHCLCWGHPCLMAFFDPCHFKAIAFRDILVLHQGNSHQYHNEIW